MNNVVKNIIWNAGYQVFAILMPLLTIPYVSRILGSETLGKATTVTSFSAFLGIAISMGLYQFGPRPIAQNENNKRELAQSFFSLWKAQLLVGLVLILGYSLYYLRHDLLYLTQIPYLVGIALDISWFYIGLGHVKKIVIRNMAVRLIGFAFVFVFVKSSKDVTLYLLILSISQLIANATFLIGLNKKIDWTLWYNTKMYSLKFLLVVMIPQIAVQVYTTLDKSIMNLFAGYTEVAYYDQSQKIARIAISLITSLSMIIMPVMAKLDQSDNNKLNKLFEVSFDFTFFISAMFTAVVIAISEQFVPWYFGESFAGMIANMMLVSIIIVFVSSGGVIANQFAMAKGLTKVYSLPYYFGAALAVTLFPLLVIQMGAMGATVGIVLIEIAVFIVRAYMVRKYVRIWQLIVRQGRVVIIAGISATVGYGIHFVEPNLLEGIIVTTLSTLTTFILLSVILRVNIIKDAKMYLIKRKNSE